MRLGQQRGGGGRERSLRDVSGVCLGRVLWPRLRGCSPSYPRFCFSVISTVAGSSRLPPGASPAPQATLGHLVCQSPLSCLAPAWSAQLSSPGLSPQAISFDKGPVSLGGRCYAVRMAARPTWLLGGQITEEWPRPGWLGLKANRLFFVFVGFEPLPQKEVGEGASQMFGLGRCDIFAKSVVRG